MGLDMTLIKRTYVKNWDHMEAERLTHIKVKMGDKKHPHIKPKRITYIIEELGEWRKANHIHKWFVDNVQEGEDDCREAYVSMEDIQDLLSVCKQVMDNGKLAEKLLPVQKGFFFGSQSYDEGYFQDVEYTIELCEEIISDGEEGGDMYYSSSW